MTDVRDLVDQFLAERAQGMAPRERSSMPSLSTSTSTLRRFARWVETCACPLDLAAARAWAQTHDVAPSTRARARYWREAEALVRWADGAAIGPVTCPPTPLRRLADAYLLERKRRGELSPLSWRNARSALWSLAATFGERPVRQLGLRHLEEWLEHSGHLAPATRRKRLSTVRGFTAWLARRGYIRADPAPDLARIRLPRYLPRALGQADVRRVLEACPDRRAVLIVLLMVQEGLRCVEVSRLHMHDVSMVDRVIRVEGKGGHERVLPITDETFAALDTFLAEYPANAGPLIRSYRKPWRPLAPDTISGLVSGWMADAGVKRRPRDGVSAHAGRHTAATDMLRAGAHVRDVQAVLGHASLQTTQRYMPLVVIDLRTAMAGRSYR
jgi:integrase/recombinase XerC